MPEKDEKCLIPATLKPISPGWLAVGAAVVGAVVAGLAVGAARRRAPASSKFVEVDVFEPDDFLDSLYFGKLEGALRRVRSQWEPHEEANSLFDSIWTDAERLGELERLGAPPPDFTIDWTRRGPFQPPAYSQPRYRFRKPPRNLAEHDEPEWGR